MSRWCFLWKPLRKSFSPTPVFCVFWLLPWQHCGLPLWVQPPMKAILMKALFITVRGDWHTLLGIQYFLQPQQCIDEDQVCLKVFYSYSAQFLKWFSNNVLIFEALTLPVSSLDQPHEDGDLRSMTPVKAHGLLGVILSAPASTSCHLSQPFCNLSPISNRIPPQPHFWIVLRVANNSDCLVFITPFLRFPILCAGHVWVSCIYSVI